jgi:hypothetical protein
MKPAWVGEHIFWSGRIKSTVISTSKIILFITNSLWDVTKAPAQYTCNVKFLKCRLFKHRISKFHSTCNKNSKCLNSLFLLNITSPNFGQLIMLTSEIQFVVILHIEGLLMAYFVFLCSAFHFLKHPRAGLHSSKKRAWNKKGTSPHPISSNFHLTSDL